jgi:molybdopterin-guanine dinucleotide biosynthesis protein A
MGTDKALVPLAGRPLIAHAVSILHQAGLQATIAGARSPLAEFAPVIEDSELDRGPLVGICEALAASTVRWAVFLPVDLPLLPASLLLYLLRHACTTAAAATLASLNGFAETFPAVIDRAALPVLQNELRAGRGGCFSAFQAAAERLGRPISVLPVEGLVQCGAVAHPAGLPAIRWFLNLNSSEQLHRAENCLRGPHRVS